MSRRRLLVLIILAAALLRAVWSATVSPAAFLEIDGADYRDIARNLAAGHGFAASAPRWFEPAALLPPGPHPDFARPPLLPLLGAALFRLPGTWEVWAHALVVMLGVLAVWLVYRAGAVCFDRSAGLAAAAIFALQPYAVFYSGRWSTETLFLVLVLGTVVMLAEGRDRLRLALAGLLAGLAVLARPTGLLLVPAFAAWIVFRHEPEGLEGSRRTTPPRPARAGIFLAAVILCLTPWTLRNHAATGRWNPGTFYAPYNLWLGMNDRVLAMYRAAGTPAFAEELDALSHRDSRAMVDTMAARGIAGPVAEGRYWSAAAGSWVRAHPVRAAEIALRRAVHYFRVTPEQTVVSRPVRLASLVLWPVHALALLGIVWRKGSGRWLLLAPPLAGLVAGLPFVFSLRYRFPFLDPYAAVFAAAGLTVLAEHLRRLRMRTRARAG